MKRFLAAMFFASTVFLASGVVCAETVEEATIEESDAINDEASTEAGRARVIDRIEDEFGVDEATIKNLRDKKLGYGEISIALSLAERLPGGITTENIDKVISMRQGPPVEGWGNVAKELNLSLKPSVEKLEKVKGTGKDGSASTEGTRAEKALKSEKAGSVERGQKPERVERVEKRERHERPERGGKK